MEVNTCEQYVIMLLNDKEVKIAELQEELEETNDMLHEMTCKFNTLYNIIRNKASIEITATKEKYLALSYVWESFDKHEFDTLVDLLDLEGENDNEENDTEGQSN